MPFGRPGKHSIEKAKNVIWPDVSAEQVAGEEIYKRSHNNYAPGEQKKRGYKWYVDPVTTRFGVAGENIALNGVSKDVAEVLSGAGETQSIISTKQVKIFGIWEIYCESKNLGQELLLTGLGVQPGASGRVGGWGTAEIIQGKYTLKEQQPDIDLGKSITPGFRNISLEDRAYGCPSIRTDLPRGDPMKRSVSDSQNYGDDVPAQDLISPPAFSDMAIDPMAFTETKEKGNMRNLFAKIGVVLDDSVFDAIYAEAGGRGTVTINSFRDVLNAYLEAVEDGQEQRWRLARGVEPGNLTQ